MWGANDAFWNPFEFNAETGEESERKLDELGAADILVCDLQKNKELVGTS